MAKSIKSIADLQHDPNNANKGNQRGRKAVDDSLTKYGAGRSIVVDQNGVVIGGNKTLEAAKAAGIEVEVIKTKGDKLVVVQREDLDLLKDHKARKLAYADNRAGELGLEWDLDQIKEDLNAGLMLDDLFSLDELSELGVDLPTVVPPEAPEAQMDAAEGLQAKWKVQRGDVWQIGEHRLMCGDNSDRTASSILFNGNKIDLLFTSPPYSQQREYGDASDVSDWDHMMRGAFSELYISDDAQILVNLGLIHRDNEWIPYWDGYIEWMRNQGYKRFGFYIWDQGFGLPGNWNGRFGPSHEFVFHFNKKAKQPKKWVDKQEENIKPRNAMESTMRKASGETVAFSNPSASAQPTKVPDSVIRIGRQVGSDGHPAQFSTGFATAIILSWDGLIYDPFLGSGTTMVAAERLGRKCYGMEIEPKYCAVILERMQQMGLEPELVENANQEEAS